MSSVEKEFENLNFNDSNNQNLGHELIEIIYSNTKLNYDVCASNLIQIFEHLDKKCPEMHHVSVNLIDSFKKSIKDKKLNTDLQVLNNSLKNFVSISNDINTGERNFYELNQIIENNLNKIIKLLTNQTNHFVFKDILEENRISFLSLYKIWQLSADKNLKNKIIQLFNTSFNSDSKIIRILQENTDLNTEICYFIKECIQTCDFLKESFFLNDLLSTIESENNFLFFKVNSFTSQKDFTLKSRLKNNHEIFMIDLFIDFILSLNKKYVNPEENFLVNFMIDSHNSKNISEKLLELFNSENDPVLYYKLNVNQKKEDESNYFYSNSVIKLLSDLFSYSKTKKTSSIFYSNDFNVLLDIIIRRISNLSANDQIRVDYLSLIQLIIKNSNYIDCLYRIDDLLECFGSILNEKDQFTIDQDIVQEILKENPQLMS